MSNERVMRLGLTISAKQSQLTISKDVIRILGSPSYVCVLQGKDKQSVAVARSEEHTSELQSRWFIRRFSGISSDVV